MDPEARMDPGAPAEPEHVPETPWSAEQLACAEQTIAQDRIEKENDGLDIANTDGILPGGGMIMMEHPTPQQEAYMARRLGLMYKREYAENLKRGLRILPKIRPLRPGDLIP